MTKFPEEYLKADEGNPNEIYSPQYRFDTRGRLVMPLTPYKKQILSTFPGSKDVKVGTEDEGSKPVTDPSSLKSGFLYTGTVLTIGDPSGWRVQLSGKGAKYPILYTNGILDYFYVDKKGNAYLKGEIEASSGKIANWHINKNTLSSAATEAVSNVLIDSANSLIRLGPSTGDYITLDGARQRLRTSNFVSGVWGSGWTLDPSGIEVANALIRGVLRTSVFRKDTISVVGGMLMVSNSDVLDEDMTADDNAVMIVKGTTTFEVNDILRIKDGANEEWFRVTDVSGAPTYVVTRDLAAQYAANDNPTWKKGTCVAKQGKSDLSSVYSGGWLSLVGEGENSPYYEVIKRTGVAYNAFTPYIRLGNLNGFLDYNSEEWGIAIGEATKYLKYDPTNGLRLAGTLYAVTGTLGALTIASGGHIKQGQTAYDTGKGFWFGDVSGTPKMSIGDSAADKMIWDGTSLISTGLVLTESLTAGEDIAAGDVVCIKQSYTDYLPSEDAKVSENDPDTNFGSETTIEVGIWPAGKANYGYFKFNMASLPITETILKAELRLRVYSFSGSSRNVDIERVSGGDIDEDTITWNNKPASTDDIASQFGMENSKVTGSSPTWMVWDITQLVRHWKAGNINNYGIKVSTGTDALSFHSKESGTVALRPVLRVYESATSDGKAYKANCNDYFLSKSIVGIATKAITAGNKGKIQTAGVNDDTIQTDEGETVYLSNIAGQTTTSPGGNPGMDRFIKIGKVTATNKLLLDIQSQDILIEELHNSLGQMSGERKLYCPRETRYALINLQIGGTSPYQTVIRANREESGEHTFTHYVERNGAYFDITWGSDYLSITGSDAASMVHNVCFFT